MQTSKSYDLLHLLTIVNTKAYANFDANTTLRPRKVVNTHITFLHFELEQVLDEGETALLSTGSLGFKKVSEKILQECRTLSVFAEIFFGWSRLGKWL